MYQLQFDSPLKTHWPAEKKRMPMKKSNIILLVLAAAIDSMRVKSTCEPKSIFIFRLKHQSSHLVFMLKWLSDLCLIGLTQVLHSWTFSFPPHWQFHYYRYLWRKASRFNTLSEKLSTFSNGPSWKPGKPRLGDHEQVPHASSLSHLLLCQCLSI